MREIRFYLKPRYSKSRALVIGINRYQRCGTLGYAVNDAQSIYTKLTTDLQFDSEDVTILLDEEATASAIRKSLLRFTRDDVDLDERIVVFYAGHGTTRTGRRGEVGFLVPVDGDPHDISTLIRWDEMTRAAELIIAKHVLFIMDACYGGLALTRSAHAGSARFLKDMLKRVARQVLTAGKADEQVSDSGGPVEGHSVFTGHLLQGLDGAAATAEGILTASGLMAYVYNKVAADMGSYQTPHFGHLEGDGDFVFKAPVLDAPVDKSGSELDALLTIPFSEDPPSRENAKSKIDRVKSLLGQPANFIELHDFGMDQVRRLLAATSEDLFVSSDDFSVDRLLDRLTRYEECTKDLALTEACIAYWASDVHHQILRKLLSRSTDQMGGGGGSVVWVRLRWYPLVIQAYCAGIAAVSARRYDTLADLFLSEVDGRNGGRILLLELSDAISNLSQSNLFKMIPEHERYYTPMSEYLFKRIQPWIDDSLFVGRGYEAAFDEFEVLLALACADQRRRSGQRTWGPVGRFGWKTGSVATSPLERIIEQAKQAGASWPPIRYGLVGDSSDFADMADEYRTLVRGLNWY